MQYQDLARLEESVRTFHSDSRDILLTVQTQTPMWVNVIILLSVAGDDSVGVSV